MCRLLALHSTRGQSFSRADSVLTIFYKKLSNLIEI
jgi:hypothetical protein